MSKNTMLLELIIALLVGIAIGTATGLLPGLHINLVAAILLNTSPILVTFISPIALAAFIVSLAITHTFIDYIPSIFLGAPEETSILSVLPGHKLLLEGYGYEALVYSLYGGLTALPIILILTPITLFLLPKIYSYITKIMFIILILFSVYLVSTEKQNIKKFQALIIFILSGFLGIATFHLAELNFSFNEPLLPLFTGLFGTSTLIISIKQKTKIPEQKIPKLKEIKLDKKSLVESSFISTITSPITAFLPGLGASQAALIGTELKGKSNEKDFLFLIGAINVLVMALSFIALYSINKTRTGAAVAVQKLIPILTFNNLLTILTIITISGILSFIISVNIAKFISKKINKINYSLLSIIIILILIFFTIYFTNFSGFLILIVSTSLGISCSLLEIKKSHLMGCLLMPTILFYQQLFFA